MVWTGADKAAQASSKLIGAVIDALGLISIRAERSVPAGVPRRSCDQRVH